MRSQQRASGCTQCGMCRSVFRTLPGSPLLHARAARCFLESAFVRTLFTFAELRLAEKALNSTQQRAFHFKDAIPAVRCRCALLLPGTA